MKENLFEETNILMILLTLNSILIISLILNQNENPKNSTIKPDSSSALNPLEKWTWICFLFQFLLFLILLKTKF